MTIRITDGYDGLVMMADGTEEFVSLASGVKEEGCGVSEQDLRAAALAEDPKHPFVVYCQGHPVFRSSRRHPDRLKGLVRAGYPAEAFRVLDLRTGNLYQVTEA